MAFTYMSFDKNWNNYADFPTHESQEAKVRADMQYLYDSIKDQFNYFLEYELRADNLPYTPTAGIQAENVQDAIDAVHAEIQDIVEISVADGSITAAKLRQESGSEAVVTNAIRDGAVLTAKLGNGAVNDAKLGDGSVYERHITTGAVTETKLASNAVVTAKIKDAAVTVDKLATNSVSTVKIVDGNVTTAKLAASAVTTAKIADLNVTTAKIANSAVTYAKTSGVQQQHSTTTVTLSSGVKAWSNVSATGVTASNTVICTPAPASFAQWVDNRVRCTAQAAGKLTFAADTNTSAAITVNVLILN